MKIHFSKESDSPIYKQIVDSVVESIRSGECAEGHLLPSMNELSSELKISKETVKKAYNILTKKGFITPRQGRGFYVSRREGASSLSVLLLFDKISPYKQILLNTISESLGPDAQLTIRLHNQSEALLEYYLDEALDTFDYYLIEPHFPMDDRTQKAVVKQLKRVPYRKLVMVDNWIKDLPGNYGAVYQDFDHDIYGGLSQGLDELKRFKRLNVITLQSSLYHERISVSVKRFCRDNDIPVNFYDSVNRKYVHSGEAFLLLNSQLDSVLLDLVDAAESKSLSIGKDIGIISYNDYPVNQLICGGLTTVSADFNQMGRLVAKMLKTGELDKIKCDFKMVRRSTF